jgi:hypothetical protein
VRVEINIILEGVSNIIINNYIKYRIIVFINYKTYKREETNIVIFLGNYNSEFNFITKIILI